MPSAAEEARPTFAFRFYFATPRSRAHPTIGQPTLPRHLRALWGLPLLLALSSCLFGPGEDDDGSRIPTDTLSYHEIAVSPRETPLEIPSDGSMKLRLEAAPGASYRLEVHAQGVWSCNRSFHGVWQESAFLRIAVATPGSIAFRYTISVRALPEATVTLQQP